MAKDDIREKIKGVYKSFVRLKFIGWVVSITAVLLIARLFYLQLIRGPFYKKLADTNCVNLVKDRAPRGDIYDRNYKKLVGSKPSYAVSIIPFHFAKNEDKEGAIKELAAILKMKEWAIREKMEKTTDYILEPVVLKRDITEKELSLLAEKEIEINGISVSQEPKRFYEYGSLGSHLLGYVGEIADRQLKLKRYKKYRAGDVMGQSGVENYYDRMLRGKDGVIYILTDARGRQKDIIDKIEPAQGKHLVLTIDYRLQKFAEKLMDKRGYKGVVIASIPKTGEILCMVSKPDYNLDYFSGKIDIRHWKKLVRNKNNPLTNRAVQGLYSPGSIFKIADGIGALEEKIVSINDTFLCEGIHWIKTWPYKCWKRSGHGWVNFNRAISESCDIYFYKVGLKMKVELLHKYAVMFGLGDRTGIDLPGEKAGVVPSREWKRRVRRTPWFPGNTVMMSIGQGFITSTPIQIMNIMSAMANGGYVMQPHLLKAVTMKGRKIYRTAENKKLFDLKISDKNIRIMRRALRSVVQGRRGTGYKARVKGIRAAGKTGTVENPHGENHPMFAGFAPYDDPEIVVYVLIEHGGGGGEAAAPIAGEIMNHYLKVMR